MNKIYKVLVLGEESPKEENILNINCQEKAEDINSFEKACTYLGREKECNPANRHHKAMVAFFKLITIAEAWNKADGFVPDYSNENQLKYYPWFIYAGAFTGFASASTAAAASSTSAAIGSRLCFKTRVRAEQFGKQFIDLWNDVLLPD
jgi:hypothetical protein